MKYRLPDGRQVQKKLGPAWSERGRPPAGHLTKRLAEDTLRRTLTPDITAVSVARHGVRCLTFADGLTGEVDVLDRMRGPIFEQALTPEGFAAVVVDGESGTIVWPSGADLAPDTLYQRIRTGLWSDENAAA
jgi:hypothetical protein